MLGQASPPTLSLLFPIRLPTSLCQCIHCITWPVTQTDVDSKTAHGAQREPEGKQSLAQGHTGLRGVEEMTLGISGFGAGND